MEMCFCNKVSVVKTSWTDRNPGRRFLSYGKRNGCSFFIWIDPPMCDRARVIILGLLRRLTEMEEEIMRAKRRVKILWAWTIFSVFMSNNP